MTPAFVTLVGVVIGVAFINRPLAIVLALVGAMSFVLPQI